VIPCRVVVGYQCYHNAAWCHDPADLDLSHHCHESLKNSQLIYVS